MKIIKHDLGADITEVNIIPLADLHLGSEHCLLKNIKKAIDEVASGKNTYTVLNGDLINNAIKTSVSDIYKEKLSPEQALNKLVELFMPIKDKILSVVCGNHEARTYRLAGIDVLNYFCSKLGVEHLYHPVASIIFLSFGTSRGRKKVRNTFSIYHTHGTGGGKTVGAKANRLQNLSNVIHADVYIHSHTHTPMIFKEDYIMTNCGNKGIKQISRLFVNTNAYEGFGGYGEVLGLKPSNHDYITIELSSNGYDKYKNARL